MARSDQEIQSLLSLLNDLSSAISAMQVDIKSMNAQQIDTSKSVEQLNRLSEAYSRLYQQGQQRGVKNAPTVDVTEQMFPETPASPRTQVAPKNAAQKKEAFSQSELKNLTNEYRNLDAILGKYGLTTKNITSASKDLSTQITTINLQHRNSAGVIENARVVLDRYGNQLEDTQKRFRSFGSTILRNIAEVAKWTIAVQVIYAPMRKFQELIDTMIANEAKLADITVAVGQAQADTSRIFDEAAKVAESTGESINGVLEGYELAYRAAGSISDPIERAITTNKLLADSMVLSKLSSLDQAQALDTLVGALNQLNVPLTDGRDLIDKWVKVSNNANVSLSTLAESFAITATSAENAGLSVDELNGIIATVAENTTLSATEAGNAVRAFISGFQTDKAQKELATFGISVKNTSGEIRDFYSIMLEIYKLSEQGLISDSELNRIGEAIGGGARRGAQVVTTIANIGRVQEVAAVSASAHGDAEEALGIKLDTVQTKVTELGNSFQKLAQTLGDDGGILDATKVLFDVLGTGVDIIEKLTGALGTATPALVAFALAYNQLTRGGGIGGVTIPTKEGGGLGALPISSLIPGLNQYTLGGVGAGIGGWIKQNPGLALGIGTTAVNAGLSASQGDWAQAGGNIAGAVVGGIISGGNPIGIALGSAIGGKFVDTVIDYEGSFANFFSDIAEKSLKSITTSTETTGPTDQDRQDFADSISRGLGPLVVQAISQGYAGVANAFNFVFNPQADQLTGQTREQAGLTWRELRPGGNAQKELQQLQFLSGAVNPDTQQVKEDSQFAQQRNKLASDYIPLLQSITNNVKEQAQAEMLSGDITTKKYDEIKNSLGGLDITIAGFYTAFADGIKKTNPELQTQAEIFQYLSEVIYKGTDEDIQYLSQLQNEYAELLERLHQFETLGTTEITVGDTTYTLSNTKKQLDDVNESFQTFITSWDKQQRLTTNIMPSIVNVDATKKDFQKILDYANSWMDQLYQDLVDNTGLELTLEEWRSTFEGFFVDLGDENGRVWVEGFSQQAITGAQKALEDMGEIFSQSNIGLKSFNDLTVEQMQSLAAQSLVMNQQLEQQYGKYGYKGDTETFIGVAKDGIAGPITAELTIMQMLMRDLIDVNEKQLEGIYNLPTDASFYVPFTGYALGQGGGSGGGGYPNPFDNVVDTGQDVPEKQQPVNYVPSPLEQFYAMAAKGTLPNQGTFTPFVEPTQPEKDSTKKYVPSYVNPDIESFSASSGGFFGKLMENFSTIGSANFMQEFLSVLPQLIVGSIGGGVGIPESPDLKSMQKTMKGTESASGIQELSTALAKAPINTNFNLSVSSNIQLYLDGQTVANVVKQYLHDEIIRQEGTSTITRNAII